MNIDKQIEFNKVKDIWAGLAVTDRAKERINETTICLSETELRKLLKETTDAKELIEKLGEPPLQNITEIKDILMIAEKGVCLTPYQLERVEKVLVAIGRLKEYLKRGKLFDNSLAYYEENLDAIYELREEISSKIRGDAVDDYASKELSQIRKEIVKCEEEMKHKAEQIMRSNKNCMADSYCTFRDAAEPAINPEDYDFSIIFDSVEKRKKRHDMQRKYTEDIIEDENE